MYFNPCFVIEPTSIRESDFIYNYDYCLLVDHQYSNAQPKIVQI